MVQKFIALLLLIPASPLLVLALLAVLLEDPSSSPLFLQTRVGLNGIPFVIYKVRTMKSVPGIRFSSTARNDPRLLRSSSIIRGFKIDELPQLLNIINGSMSFVGPRPNIPSEVAKYHHFEQELLRFRPGITDPSSIIFADESSILSSSVNPDSAYDVLIRPWKNLFALHYFSIKSSPFMDFLVVILTILNSFARNYTLRIITRILALSTSSLAYRVSRRSLPLDQAVINIEISNPLLSLDTPYQ